MPVVNYAAIFQTIDYFCIKLYLREETEWLGEHFAEEFSIMWCDICDGVAYLGSRS